MGFRRESDRSIRFYRSLTSDQLGHSLSEQQAFAKTKQSRGLEQRRLCPLYLNLGRSLILSSILSPVLSIQTQLTLVYNMHVVVNDMKLDVSDNKISYPDVYVS